MESTHSDESHKIWVVLCLNREAFHLALRNIMISLPIASQHGGREQIYRAPRKGRIIHGVPFRWGPSWNVIKFLRRKPYQLSALQQIKDLTKTGAEIMHRPNDDTLFKETNSSIINVDTKQFITKFASDDICF